MKQKQKKYARKTSDKSEQREESVETVIYEETKKRLKEMSDPSYVFPKKANKKDAYAIIAGISISLILIILCMTGVIN